MCTLLHTWKDITAASKKYKITGHLFVRSLGHTHHEEEQSREADFLHRCDEEKGVGLGVVRPHHHLHQLRQGQGAQRVQMLSQAETKGKQRQGGGHQPTKHKVTHTLFHQLHLSTRNKREKERQETSCYDATF